MGTRSETKPLAKEHDSKMGGMTLAELCTLLCLESSDVQDVAQQTTVIVQKGFMVNKV